VPALRSGVIRVPTARTQTNAPAQEHTQNLLAAMPGNIRRLVVAITVLPADIQLQVPYLHVQHAPLGPTPHLQILSAHLVRQEDSLQHHSALRVQHAPLGPTPHLQILSAHLVRQEDILYLQAVLCAQFARLELLPQMMASPASLALPARMQIQLDYPRVVHVG
jgi:hypothetical protein